MGEHTGGAGGAVVSGACAEAPALGASPGVAVSRRGRGEGRDRCLDDAKDRWGGGTPM